MAKQCRQAGSKPAGCDQMPARLAQAVGLRIAGILTVLLLGAHNAPCRHAHHAGMLMANMVVCMTYG